MKEVFKDIPGYEGLYQISNKGRIKSLHYRGHEGFVGTLTPKKHYGGYLTIMLCNDKIHKNKMIHTLVAQTFIPNPEGKPFVNHIDGNKHNNNVTNLEWVTSKENMNHAIRTGLRDPHKNNHPKGADTPNSRAVLQFTKDGQFVKRWECMSDAARFIGCNPCMLVNNASGRSKSAHGYIWKYAE